MSLGKTLYEKKVYMCTISSVQLGWFWNLVLKIYWYGNHVILMHIHDLDDSWCQGVLMKDWYMFRRSISYGSSIPVIHYWHYGPLLAEEAKTLLREIFYIWHWIIVGIWVYSCCIYVVWDCVWEVVNIWWVHETSMVPHCKIPYFCCYCIDQFSYIASLMICFLLVNTFIDEENIYVVVTVSYYLGCYYMEFIDGVGWYWICF